MAGGTETDRGDITEWRSIVTLVVFVITNIIVLFPFHIPFYVPQFVSNGFIDGLAGLRIIAPRPRKALQDMNHSIFKDPTKLRIPVNFITAPIVADLFLLAISAIGRDEVHDGTVGTDHIHPIDIMTFFITLAYIAISIDASGLIRWLAFKVLQWGGKVGHNLFFYLYAFFFSLGTFIGNDPIILSGTAFLAYMTRVSTNIQHPKAWIYSQFAIANISSAILVSSNPTNLVLAGAFNIKFITYTANMVVPVVVTAIVLFPFLLYVVFADNDLIPRAITMYEPPQGYQRDKPVNPNIPHARGGSGDDEADAAAAQDSEQMRLVYLEEIMNPFLDKKGAWFGSLIMAVTLISLLVLNAVSQSSGEHSVFWVTLPAAFIMFCWDMVSGWVYREETRKIAHERREKYEEERVRMKSIAVGKKPGDGSTRGNAEEPDQNEISAHSVPGSAGSALQTIPMVTICQPSPLIKPNSASESDKKEDEIWAIENATIDPKETVTSEESSGPSGKDEPAMFDVEAEKEEQPPRPTLVSVSTNAFQWLQDTFPTPIAVLMHLPVALVPFAFAMFVLVQALVTKGWIRVFAYGWDHWVNKTSTVGAIGGMGFLSVILCNFAGTNIGTTILLSRVIQQWYQIHEDLETPISNRTFWATVYSMALGVNYGAFSTAFSASLAGLLWRDILERKLIKVSARDFARVNIPIIAISMAVGCAVLVGEVFIVRDEGAYRQSE